jgi:hypothetical protein
LQKLGGPETSEVLRSSRGRRKLRIPLNRHISSRATLGLESPPLSSLIRNGGKNVASASIRLRRENARARQAEPSWPRSPGPNGRLS